MTPYIFFFPWTCRKQGRELLFPFFHRLLSTAISLSKRRRPTLPKAFHVLEKREKMCSSGSFWGDNTVAAPAFLSPILPINTEGESTTRRDEGSREGRGKRTERKEKKKKKRENGLKTKTIKKKKQREREEVASTANHQRCRLSPPTVQPMVAATTGQPFPLPFFFLLLRLTSLLSCSPLFT